MKVAKIKCLAKHTVDIGKKRLLRRRQSLLQRSWKLQPHTPHPAKKATPAAATKKRAAGRKGDAEEGPEDCEEERLEEPSGKTVTTTPQHMEESNGRDGESYKMQGVVGTRKGREGDGWRGQEADGAGVPRSACLKKKEGVIGAERVRGPRPRTLLVIDNLQFPLRKSSLQRPFLCFFFWRSQFCHVRLVCNWCMRTWWVGET